MDHPIVDVEVENAGGIFLFQPRTQAGREWINENVAEEVTWFGSALVVEPRYAENLVRGMQGDGLVVA